MPAHPIHGNSTDAEPTELVRLAVAELADIVRRERFEISVSTKGAGVDDTEETTTLAPRRAGAATVQINATRRGGIITVVVGAGGVYEFVPDAQRPSETRNALLELLAGVAAGGVHQEILSVGDMPVRTRTVVKTDEREFPTVSSRLTWRRLLARESHVTEFEPW